MLESALEPGSRLGTEMGERVHAARLLSEVSLSAKLQLIEGRPLTLVNPPSGFELDAPLGEDAEGAVLLFVRSHEELEAHGEPFLRAAREDRLAWLAYPKGGQLGTDLNRDLVWELTKPRGIRPVRQVSLDAVWSALRFRPA